MKRVIKFFVIIFICLFVLYLLLWPVHIDPLAWNPPAAPPLAGVYQPNDRLAAIERIPVKGIGPEDIAIDADGRIYTGLQDGRIMRVSAGGSEVTEFANPGGRPLGLKFDKSGNLIVCNAYLGLQSIAPDGGIATLTRDVNGVNFGFTNDLDIAEDGTIYFTDTSFNTNQANFRNDIFEHRSNGRLMSYDPVSKKTLLLLDNLYFPNGVAVSPDQSFILVNETTMYRITRYWLTGPKTGQHDIFIDNLPGFPDGILSNGKDRFWLALPSPRDGMLDGIMPYPFLRKIVMRLPEGVQPAPKRHPFVLGLDMNGQVIENLQDPDGKSYGFITNVAERDGKLYFGSLMENAIGRISYPSR